MRFKGETITCDICGAEISENNNVGFEDTILCRGCSAVEYKNFLESPCIICGKPMKEDTSDTWYNSDSDYAHGKCIKTLTDQQIEDDGWTNEYP